jgi:hypothetical protein
MLETRKKAAQMPVNFVISALSMQRATVLSSLFFASSALLAASACVPSGSAPPYDAGPKGPAKAIVRQSPDIMTVAFEDNFDRTYMAPALTAEATSISVEGSDARAPEGGTKLGSPSNARVPALLALLGNDAGATDAGRSDASSLLGNPFLGAQASSLPVAPIDTSAIGPNWNQLAIGYWKIENGRLCGKGARNRGIWLNRVLPINARIEFDATAETADGDLKAELWGDGVSGATTVSYTNASSYLSILGGWKNTFHVLARVNEHAGDRKQIKVDKESDDPRAQAVSTSQPYRFKVERADGHTVRWFVNGIEYLSYDDPEPLVGIGHDHFGFNNWEVKVCFDNVKVTPLP